MVNLEFPDLMKFGKNKGIIFLKGNIFESSGIPYDPLDIVDLDEQIKNIFQIMDLFSNLSIMNFIFQEIFHIMMQKSRVAQVRD